MLQLSDIRTGTQMSLQLESVMEEDSGFLLGTRFEAELNDGRFSVFAPIWQGNYYRIPPRDTVYITFLQDGVRHIFESRPVDEYTRGGISFLVLRKTTPITQVQLREDFRVPVSQEASVILHVPDGDDPGSEIELVHPARLKDLSGGGVGFYTNWDPGRFTNITMELRIDSSTEQVHAEIRRIEEGVSGSGYNYTVGAKFNFDTEREKDRIVRHIFQVQKKMIQAHGRRAADLQY